MIAVTLAIALAFCGVVAETIFRSHHDAWERASQAARNLNRAVNEELGRTVESLDLSLQAVVDNRLLPGVAGLDPEVRNRLFFDRATQAKHLGAVFIVDSQGNITLDSRLGTPRPGGYADREYFTFHRDSLDPGPHISSPYRGRLSGEWVVSVSRRLSHPDGSFAGVVVGTLRLASIRTLFEAMDLGPGGALTLFREDGTILMRTPYREAFLGGDVSSGEVYKRAMQASSGQFVASGRVLDSVRRFITHSRIERTPLLVNVSFAVADIEAGWRRHSTIVGLATLALVVTLGVGARLLCHELRRRRAAEAAARESEARVRESEANFRLLAENSSDMVSRIGTDGIRRYVSPASYRMLGRAPETLIGRRPEEQIHTDDQEALDIAVHRLRSEEADEASVTYRVRRADGVWIWVESALRVVRDPTTGERDGLVAVSRDVTDRKALETQLARLASLDGLTGIPNRRTFDETLEREWRRCARAELPISVLLIDVDRFKALNDHFGHQRGDEYLRQVGAVIGGTVRRASDLAARYGGEEFVILLPETDAEGAVSVAERVRAEIEALALPHVGDGPDTAVLTASIGVANLWPMLDEPSPGPAILIEMADQCLYEAKRTGRNRVIYTQMPATGLAAMIEASSASLGKRWPACTGSRST